MRTRFGHLVAIPWIALAIPCLRAAPLEAQPHGRLVEQVLHTPSAGPAGRRVVVYLPAGYDAPEHARARYPLLVLLHGGPGNERDWVVQGRVDRRFDAWIAARLLPPFVAVMPNAEGPGRHRCSLYMDSADGRWPVERFLVCDLLAWADRALRVVRDVRWRAIGGLSDGATGAVDLALRHPDRFGGAIGLSGEYEWKPGRGRAAILGRPPDDAVRVARHSPLRYLPGISSAAREPRIFIGCGWLDPAALNAIELDRALARAGIAHACHLRAGSHEWLTWAAALKDGLVWLWGGHYTPRPPQHFRGAA